MSEISVHDNFVYAYDVHCEQRRIVLHTEFRDRPPAEQTDVIFSDVVAHHFESVLSNNILFGIEEVDPGNIVTAWAELFARQKNYGWPEGFEYRDPQELIILLSQRGLRGYEIGSSYGLGGWVLAAKMEIVQRAAKINP